LLFNSYVFILIFLPLTLAGFHLARRFAGAKAALGLLCLASLIGYLSSQWKIAYVLYGSVGFNFLIGEAGDRWRPRARILLASGVLCNLLVLVYFKYGNVLVTLWPGVELPPDSVPRIAFPLGISFFTFQQVSYLVDRFRGRVPAHGFLQYLLYTTFFANLIAGPITRARDFFKQIQSPDWLRIDWENAFFGLACISVGLAKKTMIADTLREYLFLFFETVRAGRTLHFTDAWLAAFGFSYQIYFDFSGYSDIALGLGLLLNIRLPVNFYSPFKSTNLAEFWRRWHITVYQFIRDYVYGPMLSLAPPTLAWELILLFVSIFLFGIWHGGTLNFVIFGLVEGLLMVVYGFWVFVCTVARWRWTDSRAWKVVAGALTFGSLVPTQCFMQFNGWTEARRFFLSLVDFSGRTPSLLSLLSIGRGAFIALMLTLTWSVLFLPNSYEVFFEGREGKNGYWRWFSPGPRMGLVLALAALMVFAVLFVNMSKEYIYFVF
jgi:D-alanyl-lipoteichoic acid acyltransferase DltB (MBOAT superfamily)